MEFTLASGSKLIVSPAEFGNANALKKALMKCASPALVSALKGRSKSDILASDFTLLIEPLVAALTDETVEVVLFKCFSKAVYNSLPLSYETFDSPNPEKCALARKDYHEICFHIAKINCEVFFEQIISLLKASGLTNTSTQKPK